MSISRVLVAALCLCAWGCASCQKDSRSDADTEDSFVDSDQRIDTERESPDVDADETDSEAEADVEEDLSILPEPVAMNPVEIPKDREGRECGTGCRQLTFAAEVQILEYKVGSQYLFYSGTGIPSRVYMIDLLSLSEYLFDPCEEYWCSTPESFGSRISYSTTPKDDDTLWALWRYETGEPQRYPLVRRRMTERARPLTGTDVSENFVAWYDSAIYPAGLYAMPFLGGDVIGLTSERCVCYSDPELEGSIVIYQGWQTRYRDIWMVNVETLEEVNLTNYGAPQFDPSFDGTWAVWTDGRNDPSSDPYSARHNPDIYGMNINDRVERHICSHSATQLYPNVRDRFVVWEDFRNAEEPNEAWILDANIDIYLHDLESGQEIQVTNLPGPERRPKVWGNRVFFVAKDLLNRDAVFMIDLVEAGLVPDPD